MLDCLLQKRSMMSTPNIQKGLLCWWNNCGLTVCPIPEKNETLRTVSCKLYTGCMHAISPQMLTKGIIQLVSREMATNWSLMNPLKYFGTKTSRKNNSLESTKNAINQWKQRFVGWYFVSWLDICWHSLTLEHCQNLTAELIAYFIISLLILINTRQTPNSSRVGHLPESLNCFFFQVKW